jgi:hypothetical protein
VIVETKIPDFLIEMSKQMSEQESRMTAHPFWQVRCKRYLVTDPSYDGHHWELCNCEGVFYRSDIHDEANQEILERYPEFAEEWEKENEGDNFLEDFDVNNDDLPDDVNMVWVQETEEIVSTHFTKHDAEWFIKRKQHDYPPLYTYVESAYWSPQIKQLQDWIISLTAKEES